MCDQGLRMKVAFSEKYLQIDILQAISSSKLSKDVCLSQNQAASAFLRSSVSNGSPLAIMKP